VERFEDKGVPLSLGEFAALGGNGVAVISNGSTCDVKIDDETAVVLDLSRR
jgi:hypothetical protein